MIKRIDSLKLERLYDLMGNHLPSAVRFGYGAEVYVDASFTHRSFANQMFGVEQNSVVHWMYVHRCIYWLWKLKNSGISLNRINNNNVLNKWNKEQEQGL